MILLTISRDFYPGYLIRKVLIFLIRIYKLFLSPLLPSSCRFTPTCSEYSIDAITKYGIIRGFYISLRRVLRCHPFRPGGYDPVK